MKRIFALVVLVALSYSVGAQGTTIIVNTIKGLQRMYWNNRILTGVLTDSTFNSATHQTLPTSKAVKDFVLSFKTRRDTTLKGDGSFANPLGLNRQGASNGQALKWDNTLGRWAPGNDLSTACRVGGNPNSVSYPTDCFQAFDTTSGTIWLRYWIAGTGWAWYASGGALADYPLDGNGVAGDAIRIAPGGTAGDVLYWDGLMWQIGAVPGGGGGGSGNGLKLTFSNTAPSDTTVLWVDKSKPQKGAWPIKWKRPFGWSESGQFYDYLAKQISVGLPMNICISGQSNITGPFPGVRSVDAPTFIGDTTSNTKIIGLTTAGSWVVAKVGAQPELLGPTLATGETHSVAAAKEIVARTGKTVRLVISGSGGKPIEFWRVDSTGWAQLDTALQRGFRSGMGKVDAFMWFHGEAGSTTNTYPAQWASLLARLRTRPYFDSLYTKILAPSEAINGKKVYAGAAEAEYTLRALNYDNDPATKYFRPIDRKETNTNGDIFHYTPREHGRIGRAYAVEILNFSYKDDGDRVLYANSTNSVLSIYPTADSLVQWHNLRTNNSGAFQRRFGFAGSTSTTFVEEVKPTGAFSGLRLQWYFDNATTPTAYVAAGGIFSNKAIYPLSSWDATTTTPTGGIVFDDPGGLANDQLIARLSSGALVYNSGNNNHSFRVQNVEKMFVGASGVSAPLINLTGTGTATGTTGLVFIDNSGTANDAGIWRSSDLNGFSIYYKAGASAGNNGRHEFYVGDTQLASFDRNSGDPKFIFLGKVGTGSVSTPTASLHLPPGTASANSAPLKFTAGVNLTTPEVGAVEFDGTRLYMTQTGVTRRTIAFTSDISNIYNSDGTLAGNRVVTLGSNALSFVTNNSTASSYPGVEFQTFSNDETPNPYWTGKDQSGTPRLRALAYGTYNLFQSLNGNLGLGASSRTLVWKTNGALSFPSVTVASPTSGDVWYSAAQKLMYQEAGASRTVATVESDFTGSTNTIAAATHTPGADYTVIYDATSNSISATLGVALAEGHEYIFDTNNNATNSVTLVADSGYSLSVAGSASSTQSSYVVPSYGILSVTRRGTLIVVKP
jgi:hypothetical protein